MLVFWGPLCSRQTGRVRGRTKNPELAPLWIKITGGTRGSQGLPGQYAQYTDEHTDELDIQETFSTHL